MEKDTFLTSDLYLAAFITHQTKKPPTLEMRDNRVVFSFTNDRQSIKALNDFNSDEPIGAFSFSNAVKQLRTTMIRRKER